MGRRDGQRLRAQARGAQRESRAASGRTPERAALDRGRVRSPDRVRIRAPRPWVLAPGRRSLLVSLARRRAARGPPRQERGLPHSPSAQLPPRRRTEAPALLHGFALPVPARPAVRRKSRPTDFVPRLPAIPQEYRIPHVPALPRET